MGVAAHNAAAGKAAAAATAAAPGSCDVYGAAMLWWGDGADE